MKLSEAMRLGTMLRPQTVVNLLTEQGSCALGAAGEAAGLFRVGDEWKEFGYTSLSETWPILYTRSPGCPVCRQSHGDRTLGETITSLNDIHEWTREMIADWVETIERRHEQVAPAVVKVTC